MNKDTRNDILQVAGLIAFIVAMCTVVVLAFSTKLEAVHSLKPEQAQTLVTKLEKKGYRAEISGDGTVVKVAEFDLGSACPVIAKSKLGKLDGSCRYYVIKDKNGKTASDRDQADAEAGLS